MVVRPDPTATIPALPLVLRSARLAVSHALADVGARVEEIVALDTAWDAAQRRDRAPDAIAPEWAARVLARALEAYAARTTSPHAAAAASYAAELRLVEAAIAKRGDGSVD